VHEDPWKWGWDGNRVSDFRICYFSQIQFFHVTSVKYIFYFVINKKIGPIPIPNWSQNSKLHASTSPIPYIHDHEFTSQIGRVQMGSDPINLSGFWCRRVVLFPFCQICELIGQERHTWRKIRL
jgi:hypothetical protein